MNTSFALKALLAAAIALGVAAPAQARHRKKHAPPPVEKPEPAPAEKPPEPAAPKAEKPHEEAQAPAAEVHAAEGPSLTVVGVPLDPRGDAEAALAVYFGEQAVRRAGKQKLVPLEDLLDPDAAATRAKAQQDGDRALTFAKKAYFQDLDLETAAALCDKAYAAYLKSDLPQNFNKLIEAIELKIAAFSADPKKADRVKAELSMLLPVDPRSELSPNLFNPDTIKLAQGMRQKLKDDALLTLKVRANTPARVFVDGSFRGITPTTVAHLAPGSHFVTVVAPGYLRVQEKVNPGPDPTFTAKLEPAELTVQQGPRLHNLEKVFRSEELGAALAQLGSSLKVDQVLALAALEGPTHGSRQVDLVREQVRPPEMLDDLDAPLPPEDAKAAAAVDGLVSRGLTDEKLLLGHRAPLSGGSGRTMQYAGYGLIGGGVVSAGLFTYFGLAAKGHQSDFRTLPQTDPSASSVASSGHTDATIANVTLGVAIAAVGAGVTLLILDHLHAKAAHDEANALPPPGDAEVGPAHPRPDEEAKPQEESKPAPEEEPAHPAEAKPAPREEPPASREEPPAHTEPAPTPEPSPAPPAHTEPEPAPLPPPTAAPSQNAPDAGAPLIKKKKPPKDLGEDIEVEDW